MALCTQCGAILHEEDMNKHKCLQANIPIKGKEKLPNTVEANVEVE